MAGLASLIEGMDGERREGALAVLDHLSRPMTAREIEARLRRGGISQARAAKIAAAVAGWHIVALIAPSEK